MVIKVGAFSQDAENHTSVDVVDAIIDCFDKAPKILVAESDNYKGTGSERLQIWKDVYTERVEPFNLSNDSCTKTVQIAGQQMKLSHILFKPNVFVTLTYCVPSKREASSKTSSDAYQTPRE